MRKRRKKSKDGLISGSLFEAKKQIRGISNRKFPRNIILGNDVYMDIDAGLESYKKSNFIYGDLEDIRECFFEPNMLQMNMSYIVKDYDGILYETYKDVFESNGFNVKCINFIDFAESYSYNVFEFFNYEQDVRIFVDLITKSFVKEMTNSEKIVKNAEKLLLEALLYYVMLELPNEEHNMNTVLQLLKLAKPKGRINDEYESDLDLLFKRVEKESTEENNMALYKYNKFRLAASHIERMVIENIQKYLALYTVPSIKSICNNDEVKVEELVDNYEILFVITPSEAPEYEKIADVFIYQTMMYLDYLAEKKYKGELPCPIHIMTLDMITPIMDVIVDNCYKKNLFVTIGTDKLSKFSDVYEDVKVLIEKCSVFICYDYNNVEIKSFVKNYVIDKYNSDISTVEKIDKELNLELEEHMDVEQADCIIFIQYAKAICTNIFEVDRMDHYIDVKVKEQKQHMIMIEQLLAGQIYSNLLSAINQNKESIKVGECVNIDIGMKKLIPDEVYDNITMKVKKR